MAAGGSRKAILAAAAANGGIAIAKFLAFLATGASSMLAESIHSVADTSNQGLLILGSSRAERDASERHPFGYGRERYFWSFIVAIVLFLLGGLFALYEGWEKLQHPHAPESLVWAIGVLVVGIGLESYSMRTAIVESNRIRGDRSWTEFIRRSRTPELPVVLLEDAGALIGLVIALVGVSLSLIDPVFDALATILIGALLTVIAIVLAVEMRSLLLGEAATPADVAAIETTIRGEDAVRDLLHLRTQHIGPEDLLVAGKIRLHRDLAFGDIAATIDRIEAAVRERVPVANMIYLEPGIDLDEHERPAETEPSSRADGHGQQPAGQ